MKRITVDLVMSFNPCYNREHVKNLFGGKKWMMPLTVLKLDTVSAEDKIWLLCRNEFVSEQNLRLFACDCAERVLPIFEKECPEDNRPRKAIEVARLFADGEATHEELDAVWDAAWDAAYGVNDILVSDLKEYKKKYPNGNFINLIPLWEIGLYPVGLINGKFIIYIPSCKIDFPNIA